MYGILLCFHLVGVTLADEDTNHCIQAGAHVVSADFDMADVDLNVI